jgi:hypothetical protein
MENLMEWRLAGETEVLGENLPQRHFVLVTLMQHCAPKFSFIYTLWCRVTVLMKTDVYEQVIHQCNRMIKYIYNIILAMVTEATATSEVMILSQPPPSHPCSRFWRSNTYQSLSLDRILIQFTHLLSLQHISPTYFTSWWWQILPKTSVNFNQLTQLIASEDFIDIHVIVIMSHWSLKWMISQIFHH